MTKTQIQCFLDQLTVHLHSSCVHSLSCCTRIRILNIELEFFKSQDRLNKKMIRTDQLQQFDYFSGMMEQLMAYVHNYMGVILIYRLKSWFWSHEFAEIVQKKKNLIRKKTYAKTRHFKCAVLLYQLCACLTCRNRKHCTRIEKIVPYWTKSTWIPVVSIREWVTELYCWRCANFCV
jgi:hypothetical protein